MITNINIDSQNLQEYLSDQRLPIKKLYQQHQLLVDKYQFHQKLIFSEKFSDNNGKNIELPVCSYTTNHSGPALWIIAGIHGEEPAGPNALAQKITLLGNLNQTIPLVVLPMCNPRGYFLNWRYRNQAKYSNETIGQSVGDSEHYLPDNPVNPTKPRADKPSCPQSAAFTKHILELSKTYPPILSLDLHEDDLLDKGYIYSQGKKGITDPIAQYIVKLLINHNYPLHLSGQTRFQETIAAGVVGNSLDGSIDELLASKIIFINNQQFSGPATKSTIIIETSAQNQPLSQRQAAHELILDNLEELWKIATNKN